MVLIACTLAWQGVAWYRLLHSQTVAPLAATEQQPVAQRIEDLLPLFADSQTSSAATPATNLQWILLGSFAHADAQQSSALIQNETAKAKRYRVGDTLAPGIQLQAVYPDKVELLRNGRLEILPFKRRPEQTATDAAADSALEDPALAGLDPEQLSRELQSLDEQFQQQESAHLPAETPMEENQ